MPLLPLALFGLGVFAWQYLTGKNDPSMVGADESGAFASYPRGCTGEPKVKAHSVPNGCVYRVSVWACEGTPYTHYAVAQQHLNPTWISFKVSPGGKRKFWRGNGTPNDINRACIELGVTK